jgi:hypothetical protein
MDALTELPRRKPLLATILESEHVLDGEKMERALRFWNHRRKEGTTKAFGQIVLELRLLPPAALAYYVRLQRRMAHAPGRRRPLGVLAVESGVATATVIAEVLDEQAEKGGRLGDLLLSRGILRRHQLDTLLIRQRHAA